MSSLVDEKLTENLSFLKVESIPDFDELELRINGSGRTVFLLSPAVLKIHDFFGGKVQLDELTYRRMFSDY
ncbi:MAG: hypothetical protein U9P44_02125, partial [archaeon]|nr:hypothetical protein [archaeon]